MTVDARGAAAAIRAALEGGSVSAELIYGTEPGRWPCVLHGGDGSNLQVWPDGRWTCHSTCGTSGDAIDFLAVRELGHPVGEHLRGVRFLEAVALTLERLGIDAGAFSARPRKQSKPYPPAAEVASLLALAHDVGGSEFLEIGGRERVGIGRGSIVAGLGLCARLGEDTRSARPRWARRWPPGIVVAVYDDRGGLATLQLRPDEGGAKNPAKYSAAGILMNAELRAVVRGQGRDEKDRALLLGTGTALEHARAEGIVLTEGVPAWLAWSRWHPGPVGGVPGQAPARELLARLPRDAPILLDFDPDAAGLGYLRKALVGLERHPDVRLSARMRWIVSRAARAKSDAGGISEELRAAQGSAPALLDPDDRIGGPRDIGAGFRELSADERASILGAGKSQGEWATALRRSEEGKVLATEGNFMVAIGTDPRWKDVIALDERSGQVVIRKAPPVPSISGGTWPRDLRDSDVSQIGAWYETELSVAFNNAAMHRGIDAVASLNGFDSLGDYLIACEAAWDGEFRIDAWLATYLGVERSTFTEEVGAKWLVSAAARGIDPGSKVDHVLVLEGPQGARKSSALRALCPVDELFTDSIPDLRNEKSAAEAVSSGAWIVELAELDAASRAEMSAVKAFVTKRVDSFRPAYGRKTVRRPRRVVFAGSTNDATYLRDTTGARRFWPVKVSGKLDVSGIERDRDQLWGEAVSRYRAGVVWWLSEASEEEARVEQEARREVDPWERTIEAYLETWRGAAERDGGVSLASLPGDCLRALEIEEGRADRADMRRITAILIMLGWNKVRRGGGHSGFRRRAWVPGEAWLSRGAVEEPGADAGADTPGLEGIEDNGEDEWRS